MMNDNVCIITGAANGIGKAVLAEFVSNGCKVAFIDKDKETGEKLFSELNGDHYFFHGDIGEKNVLESFTTEVIKKYGTIHYLIHNACFSNKGILSDCSYEDFNEVLRVGVTAPYMLTKLLLPALEQNASVVMISSTRAFMSQKDTESYTAAKGGITALTHALAVSLAGRLRVNSISPGWIDTTGGSFTLEDSVQHPSGRIGRPEDIAKLVSFLCGEHAQFINGENIVIDGGMTKQMIYHGDEGWNYNRS